MYVSIPFIAGQWSLLEARREAEARRPVSIPFIAGQWSLLTDAVTIQWANGKVSIPFIAGQWSLHPASLRSFETKSRVSIPFIAGQWSLLSTQIVQVSLKHLFQSPSLRGSGRFSRGRSFYGTTAQECFNPLHCGAVVASPSSALALGAALMFQSPSLRGSGRFGANFALREYFYECFNPLHCGAVVASRSPRYSRSLENSVSIPFIAGQWSLLIGDIAIRALGV